MSSKARGLADLGNAFDDGAITGTNMVINGAMQVAQRGTSATITTAGSSYDALDRFESYRNSSYAPNFTVSRDTTGPAGFSRSLKIDVDATATPTTGQNFGVRTKVEGFDAAQTGLGTSGSKQITLSFYVKSNKTGTYGTQVFRHGSTTYSTTKGYTIDAADTWERKEITYTALTTANTPKVATAWGIMIHFELSSGPNDIVAPFDWAAQGAARTVTGQVNLMDSTSNYWQITGVCLNVGDSAIDFPHESYGETLAKCQRYLQKIGNGTSDYKRFAVCYNWATGGVSTNALMPLPVQLRSLPSLSTVGTFAAYHGNASLSTVSGITFETAGSSLDVASLQVATTGLVRGDIAFLIGNNDASAAILLDAEL
jgi:hypothetical protein